jgi:hypothetical protein
LIDNLGDSLEIYEMHFNKANVNLGPKMAGEITL